jgi:hypothetical protein
VGAFCGLRGEKAYRLVKISQAVFIFFLCSGAAFAGKKTGKNADYDVKYFFTFHTIYINNKLMLNRQAEWSNNIGYRAW